MSLDLQASLETLFPDWATIRAGRIEAWQRPLHPEEQAVIARSQSNRQQEFVAGRSMVRDLFHGTDLVHFPLLPSRHRSPLWPPGWVGSISHSREHCGVVLASDRQARGLGLDIEELHRVTPRLWERLLTPAEARWLSGITPADQEFWATTIFAAKEALFKILFPLSGEWLGFQSVQMEFPEPGSILATVHARDAYRGRHAHHGPLILAGFWL